MESIPVAHDRLLVGSFLMAHDLVFVGSSRRNQNLVLVGFISVPQDPPVIELVEYFM